MPGSRRIATPRTAKPSRVVAPLASRVSSVGHLTVLRPATGPAATLFPAPTPESRSSPKCEHARAHEHGLPRSSRRTTRSERRRCATPPCARRPERAHAVRAAGTSRTCVVPPARPERSLVGAAGIAISPLAGLTDQEMARLDEAADRASSSSGCGTPPAHLVRAAAGGRDIQHARVLRAPRGPRRAQPGWRPAARPAAGSLDALSATRGAAAAALVRPAGVRCSVRRTDTGGRATLLPCAATPSSSSRSRRRVIVMHSSSAPSASWTSTVSTGPGIAQVDEGRTPLRLCSPAPGCASKAGDAA